MLLVWVPVGLQALYCSLAPCCSFPVGLSTAHCACQVMPCQWGKIDLDSVFGKASQSLVAHLNVEGQHRGAVAAARANAQKHAHAEEHGHSHEHKHEHNHDHGHGASSADFLQRTLRLDQADGRFAALHAA